MFKRNGSHAPLKVIFSPAKRQRILEGAHEQLGHRGEQAVMYTCKQRFFWPSMWNDIRHHVRSCHQCQIRSVRKPAISIIVSAPSTIFLRIYIDVMYMPTCHDCRYIGAARDDLSGAAEGRALKRNDADSMAKFIWEEILCRYGAVGQVTTETIFNRY